MTDNTSNSMRLNSSKHAHAPDDARPCGDWVCRGRERAGEKKQENKGKRNRDSKSVRQMVKEIHRVK